MAISTETIILKVEGQTDGAVKATQNVTRAQQEMKTAATAAQTSLNGVAKALTQAQVPASQSTSLLARLSDGLQKAGFDAKTFSGGLKEIGKGMTMDLVRQGLKALGSEIGGVGSSAIGAAASGAMMGMTFAGPVGAAIGGVTGLVGGFVTSLRSADKASEEMMKTLRKQWKEEREEAEHRQRLERARALYAPTLEREAAYLERVRIAQEGVNNTIEASAKAYDQARESVAQYDVAILKLDWRLRDRLREEGLIDPDSKSRLLGPKTKSEAESDEEATGIKIFRGRRDAIAEAYEATKSYGGALREIRTAENQRRDRMADLLKIHQDERLTIEERNRALAEYNTLNKQLAPLAQQEKDLAEAQKAKWEAAKQAAEEAAKVWQPILDRAAMPKADPWAGAKAEEALALMLSGIDSDLLDDIRDALESPWTTKAIEERNAKLYDHDRSVADKMRDSAREDASAGPGLDDQLKTLAAIEKLKTDRRKSFLESAFGSLDEFNAYKAAFQGLTGGVSAAMQAWITGSMTAGQAIKKFVGEYLSSLSVQLAVEALKHGAYAIASLIPGPTFNPGAASGHAIAAAKFGGAAALAAIAARGMGRGGTQYASGGGSSAAGAGGAGGGSLGSAPSQPTTINYYIVGDNHAEDSPRMRQRNAERTVQLAERRTSVGRAE